ncbi:unnamed protein product [Litomosoides sigmodontis]|uniref:Uncharacterized protein n=1 Tax=Litomosoides sigmodontis TaxID=42156 RepID=A0A3P6SRN0_LITSI|nr:unnamed protein product [Litomosoides sigmodontis]
MLEAIRNGQENFQSYALSDKILEKREISRLSNIAKLDEIEGSGVPSLLSNKQKDDGAGTDIEWDGSGASPDDEDGDVIEGSGAHIDQISSSPVTSTTSAYPSNITRTTTLRSSFDIHELGEPDEDVAIEEVPATTVTSITVQSWTTTSKRPLLPLTRLITQQTAPPTVFDEKHNIPFDTLLKPGVLADK